MGSLVLPHGTAAIVIIALLLFAEEVGLPLFFISGDFGLLGAGVMGAAGTVDARILLPAAAVAVLGGALLAFAWSGALGADRLHGLARRLPVPRHLLGAERRLRAAGALGVLGLRFVPGMRVYSTMVVGALRMDPRTFLRGLVPSVALWVGGFTLLGCVAGGPVDAVMGAVEHCTLEAGMVAAATVAVVVTVRKLRLRRSGAAA